METSERADCVLTDDELEVMQGIVAAWNAFVRLPKQQQDDVDDFRRAVHDMQRIMAVRAIRRQGDYWGAAD